MAFQRKSRLAELQAQVEKESKKGGSDERFWKPTMGKDGNAAAIIRFLPPPGDETLCWKKVYTHGFQGPDGSYLLENCLTSFEDEYGKAQQCPVCRANSALWKQGDEDTARQRKRKLQYYSNILVVNDPSNPENNGKVFLYRYGVKIHDKITAALNPQKTALGTKPAIDVFDPWEGANFTLLVKTVGGYWNYDDSTFEAPSAITSDESVMDSISEKVHSLVDYLPYESKNYAQLEDRLNTVLNARPAASPSRYDEDDDGGDQPSWAEPAAAAPPMPQSLRDELNSFNSPDITPQETVSAAASSDSGDSGDTDWFADIRALADS
jgi:hypothetical protein